MWYVFSQLPLSLSRTELPKTWYFLHKSHSVHVGEGGGREGEGGRGERDQMFPELGHRLRRLIQFHMYNIYTCNTYTCTARPDRRMDAHKLRIHTFHTIGMYATSVLDHTCTACYMSKCLALG